MHISERIRLKKAVDQFNKMQEGDDEEMAHVEAENIIMSLLTDLGFGDAAKAFNDASDRVGFWYA